MCCTTCRMYKSFIIILFHRRSVITMLFCCQEKCGISSKKSISLFSIETQDSVHTLIRESKGLLDTTTLLVRLGPSRSLTEFKLATADFLFVVDKRCYVVLRVNTLFMHGTKMRRWCTVYKNLDCDCRRSRLHLNSL